MKQYLFLALAFPAATSFGMEDCSRWGACSGMENNQSVAHSSGEVATIYKQLESLGDTQAELAHYVFLTGRLREINQGNLVCTVQNKANAHEPLDLREIRNNILNAQHELAHLELFGDNPDLCQLKRNEIARLKALEKLT